MNDIALERAVICNPLKLAKDRDHSPTKIGHRSRSTLFLFPELVEALRPVPDLIDDAQLQSLGYVVHTLQTALHDALTVETAEEAIVTAVNRGNDTDTVGAVTGALAGARFGSDALPDRWGKQVDETDDLELLATALAETNITGPV